MFIIGGGPSLLGFDWNLLKGKKTIGCNSAFKLGHDYCNVSFFADSKFFTKMKDELAKFPGDVVTNCVTLEKSTQMFPWLKVCRKEKLGLHRHAIGLGYNSGCASVNLALLFGAKRVFLLGFDCNLPAEKPSHWHNWKIEEPNPKVYKNFLLGWKAISGDIARVFPGTQIINLNPQSSIPFFPKAAPEQYLGHGTHLRRVG